MALAPNPIINLIDNLGLVLSQIKDGESSRKESSEFSLDTFWNKIGAIYKLVSKEATKICLAYSRQPLPSNSDCQELVAGMEQTVLALVSIFYSLPKTQGLTLRKLVKLSVISVIEGVQDLLQKIVENGCTDSPEMQRQATGNVWHCCESVQDIPKDNRLAALSVTKGSEELIKDAVEELDQEISNQGSCFDDDDSCNEDAWSDAERTLVTACLGLVKVAKTVLKKVRNGIKTNGRTETVACILQYDDLIDRIDHTSPAVDLFVSGLYPPMQFVSITENAKNLSTMLESLLEYFKSAHFYIEEDSHWITFLQNATKHNMEKISQNIHAITHS